MKLSHKGQFDAPSALKAAHLHEVCLLKIKVEVEDKDLRTHPSLLTWYHIERLCYSKARL